MTPAADRPVENTITVEEAVLTVQTIETLLRLCNRASLDKKELLLLMKYRRISEGTR